MISAMLGNITTTSAQAIVNSANPSLLAGGGVCGAIHRAAGPQLELECRKIGVIASGEAILTDAFYLPAQYVIHAVGPRYLDGNRGEAETLAQTYRSICALVEEYTITSVSIPSIGTGIYRFPLELAAETAVATLKKGLPSSCVATFICFDDATLAAYAERLK
jgi:O-acetyl-ADP-ribose deacetylase (regulator of RNase III)